MTFENVILCNQIGDRVNCATELKKNEQIVLELGVEFRIQDEQVYPSF